MNGKVDYQFRKTNARDILFNPYQQLEDEETNTNKTQQT
jgi:hypothetical protein